MKKIVLSLAIILLLAACGTSAAEETTTTEAALTVILGDNEQAFSVSDLQALPSAVSSFNDVEYKGVTMEDLLSAAGITAADVTAIKGVATDGFSVNYEPAQVFADGVVVAYALGDDSSMSGDDGTFRMVLPDQEGKLNLRMLYKIIVNP